MALIYLDYNRTTPIAPSVLEAMKPYWIEHFMLPCQEHVQAQAVGEALEGARQGVAQLVGCEPFEIVFTGGGTEANNLGILGLARTLSGDDDEMSPGSGSDSGPGHSRLADGPPTILVGALESDSVLRAAESLRLQGWRLETVPCDSDGVVHAQTVESMIDSSTRLMCIQAASSVLGTIQPVREIADACHSRGVLVHCDATQSLGKTPLDARQLRVDTLSVSSHKFYGPKGCGALYVRRGLPLAPIAFGEPREMGLRPGAENVPACIGMGAAAAMAAKCVQEASEQLRDLRDALVNGVLSSLRSKANLLCEDAPRLPNTLAIEMPCDAKRVQKMARQLVIATAQSESPADEITRSLRAIDRSDSQVGRTVCLSLGWTSSHDQVSRAVELLADACETVIS